jgi:hypothetical protein
MASGGLQRYAPGAVCRAGVRAPRATVFRLPHAARGGPGIAVRSTFQISGKCIGFTRTRPSIATYGYASAEIP